MNEKKYIGIYYPNSWIKDKNSLATFCLFFDEIHLVTHSDDAKDPTSYLKKLPDTLYIYPMGNPPQEEVDRLKAYYQFAFSIQPLLKEVIYYHPHLLTAQINDITHRLLHGGIPADDFRDFISWKTPEMQTLSRFYEENPQVKDEIALRVAPTALFLAKQNDWILIGDNPNMPVPVFSERVKSVRDLTSILAEECIRISLPQCQDLCAEDILAARDKLKDVLIPFRMSMQKMSGSLRAAIKDGTSIEDIRREAKFIVESNIEPALFEMKQKIEIEKDKLWLKIFGSIVSWIPFVAKAFLAPSPDQIYKTMVKMYGDVGKISDSAKDFTLSKEAGLSFLLGVEKVFDPTKK